jgi:hypothetical protein
MDRCTLLSLRPDRRRASARVATLAVVALLAAAALSAGAARGDNLSTIRIVLAAQLAEVQQEKVLNKCLAASPRKNTPCTLREALKLANLATRLIGSITATLDGTEKACVRTAALNEIAYLKLWRQAMFLLRANHRLQAKRLLIKSGPLLVSLTKTEKTCFAEALLGSP